MGKKGNRKGGAFERLICKMLSAWWLGPESKDIIFWRTSASGATAKTRFKQGKKTSNQYGDIHYTDQRGAPLLYVCSFELKNGYGKWSPLDFIDKPKSNIKQKIDEFLNKSATDCKNAGALWPVLICRRKGRKEIIIFPLQMYERISSYQDYSQIDNHITFYFKGLLYDKPFIVCRFSDFLEWVKPEFFRHAQKKVQEAKEKALQKKSEGTQNGKRGAKNSS